MLKFLIEQKAFLADFIDNFQLNSKYTTLLLFIIIDMLINLNEF